MQITKSLNQSITKLNLEEWITMATVIRLKRGGRRHAPYYRVVVIDSRSRSRGREVDHIGFYHPCARPAPTAEVDTKKALEWLARGARLTDTVRDVFSKKGIMAAYTAGKKPADVESVPAEAVAPPSVSDEAPENAATE
jgi:small subunit ribosomal protein S16